MRFQCIQSLTISRSVRENSTNKYVGLPQLVMYYFAATKIFNSEAQVIKTIIRFKQSAIRTGTEILKHKETKA